MDEFISFVFQLKTQNVSFIAMENEYWIYPDMIQLINNQRNTKYNIEMITQIRNPFTRFVSNFFYEINRDHYRENAYLRINGNIKQRLLAFHQAKKEKKE